MKSKLFIISNESIYHSQNNFFCDNLDMKSTPEGLNNSFDISIIARSSKKIRAHKIDLKNIRICKNIFSFIFSIFRSFKNKNSRYLLISISPFTFISCVILAILRKKPIVFLRSDGYEEYRAIFGFAGPIIYHFMFFIVSKISRLIGCGDKVLRNQRGHIVYPSQLSEKWFLNKSEPDLAKIKLLYIGRIRVEKGVFFFLNMMKEINQDITLTVVGKEKIFEEKNYRENISFHDIETSDDRLINYYDNHNIFVLPSYTEGYPMVILESLARERPIIIFNEIEHIVGNRKGIFISNRSIESFLDKVNYIKDNYKKIQEEMKKNNLPSKKEFLIELKKSILNQS